MTRTLPADQIDIALAICVFALLLTMHTGQQLSASETKLADPTVASSAILERLQVQPKTQMGEEKIVALPALRLRAIVLRDVNHGTAIMSCRGHQWVVVRLSRNATNSILTEFRIGRSKFKVIDFDAKTILLQHDLGKRLRLSLVPTSNRELETPQLHAE